MDAEATTDAKSLNAGDAKRGQRPQRVSLFSREAAHLPATLLRPAASIVAPGARENAAGNLSGHSHPRHFSARPAPQCCSAKRCAGELPADAPPGAEEGRFSLRSQRAWRAPRWAFFDSRFGPLPDYRLLAYCLNRREKTNSSLTIVKVEWLVYRLASVL
jgi:hypothetical protein